LVIPATIALSNIVVSSSIMASRLLARRFASSAAAATAKKPIHVAVTGAAGAIGYALLMRIARFVCVTATWLLVGETIRSLWLM